MTMLPPGSVTRIGSATESMTRSSRSRSARASASVCAQLAVVVLELGGGPLQVGDVAQDGHDAGALAGVGGQGAQQLEEQVGAVDGVDQRHLVARRLGALHRVPGERGREQHVVERHRPAPAFALVVVGGQQCLGPRVGDDDPPLAVGEEDRVGHRVDDARQQPALALQAALGVLHTGPGDEHRQPGAHDTPQPARLPGQGRRRRRHQQQTGGQVAGVQGRQRDRLNVALAQRGDGAAGPVG